MEAQLGMYPWLLCLVVVCIMLNMCQVSQVQLHFWLMGVRLGSLCRWLHFPPGGTLQHLQDSAEVFTLLSADGLGLWYSRLVEGSCLAAQ